LSQKHCTGLFPAQFGAILRVAMKRWSTRHILVLFLAVFVTAGMSLSTVLANEIALKMTMASDMGLSGHDDCNGCPAGDDDAGAKAMTCAAVCVAPVLAILPQTGATMAAVVHVIYPAPALFLQGRAPPPDLYPPRTSDIG
jgi:hypothetical protein